VASYVRGGGAILAHSAPLRQIPGDAVGKHPKNLLETLQSIE